MWESFSSQLKILLWVVTDRLFPILLMSFVSYGAWSAIEWFRCREETHDSDVRTAAIGFSFVGITIGVLVGASKTPLGETALTGFLGLVTAFAAYAYSKESLDRYRPYIAPILVTLSISLISGVYYGATLRQTSQAKADRLQLHADLGKRLQDSRMEVCRESAIKAAEKGNDPIRTMNPMCRLELGFFVTPPKIEQGQ